MSLLRAVAAILALAWIIRGAWEPNWIGSVFVASSKLKAMYSRPEPGGIEYRRFLDDLSRSTPPSSSITLIAPSHETDEFPSAYTRRAKYLLAPRIVVQRTASAAIQTDFVALWQEADFPLAGYQPVWSYGGGSLLHRRERP